MVNPTDKWRALMEIPAMAARNGHQEKAALVLLEAGLISVAGFRSTVQVPRWQWLLALNGPDDIGGLADFLRWTLTMSDAQREAMFTIFDLTFWDSYIDGYDALKILRAEGL